MNTSPFPVLFPRAINNWYSLNLMFLQKMLWLKLPWASPRWEKLDFGMGHVPSKVCWSIMSRLCTSTSSPKDVSCGAVLLENSLLVLTLLDRAWETGKSVTSRCCWDSQGAGKGMGEQLEQGMSQGTHSLLLQG